VRSKSQFSKQNNKVTKIRDADNGEEIREAGKLKYFDRKSSKGERFC
jgi:hypothetical protein